MPNVPKLNFDLGALFQPRGSLIGIDLGSRRCSAVQLSATEMLAPIASTFVLNRADPDAEYSVDELRQLLASLKRRGFVGESIVVCMPSEQVTTEMLELPRRDTDDELHALARMQLASSLQCAPSDIEMESWPLPTKARGRNMTRLLTVAVRRADVNAFVDRLESAGFDVAAVDVDFQASLRASVESMPSSDADIALVRLGWDAAGLTLVCDRTVVYQRALEELGVAQLARDLQRRLDLDADAAELVLDQVGLDGSCDEGELDSAVRAEAGRVLEAYVRHIASELTMSSGYLRQEHGGREIGRIIMLGEGASIPGVAERVGASVGVETCVARATISDDERGLWGRSAPYLISNALGLARYSRRWCA